MSTPVLPVQFDTEPIIGWRGWRFIKPSYLADYNTQTIWEPGQKLVAECRLEQHVSDRARFDEIHKDGVPAELCSCGFYAKKDWESIVAYLYPHTAIVFGEVYLWGRVIEASEGYRAQYAYPKRLIFPENLGYIAEYIGFRWGVPVEVWEDSVLRPKPKEEQVIVSFSDPTSVLSMKEAMLLMETPNDGSEEMKALKRIARDKVYRYLYTQRKQLVRSIANTDQIQQSRNRKLRELDQVWEKYFGKKK